MINYPRILINRRAALGDILMATPIVRKLFHDRQGKCFIDFSVNQEYEPLLKHSPYIRNIIAAPYETINLHEYDIIINLDLVYEKNPLLHPVDAYSKYVFGIELSDKTTELFTDDYSKDNAKRFKEVIGNDYLVLHLRNAYGASRNLSMRFWHELIGHLINKTEQRIIFIGSLQDNFFQGHNRLIDARGQFDLLSLKEVISQSRLFVGTDSGPMHIAASTDVDIVAMFTSVEYNLRHPFRSSGNFFPFAARIDCYGCQARFLPPVTSIHCLRNDYECVNRFDPLTIAEKIVTILQK